MLRDWLSRSLALHLERRAMLAPTMEGVRFLAEGGLKLSFTIVNYELCIKLVFNQSSITY